MKNSKFLDTLRTLNKDELSAFGKHLARNYGKEKIALDVFDYIKAFFPDYCDDKKLDIAYAYKKIFGGDIANDPYNRKKILNALSDLNGRLKEFLLWQKSGDESLESRILWLLIAKERGLKHEEDKQFESIRAHITASSIKSTADLLKGILVNYSYYYTPTNSKLKNRQFALAQCTTDLDKYYAITRLKLACEVATLQNLTDATFQQNWQLHIDSIMKWPGLAEEPLFQIYTEAFRFIVEQSEAAFYKTEDLLERNLQIIGKEELHVILSYLHNFTARQIRQNKPEYVPIIHRLNRLALEQGYFQRPGFISPTQFTNVVTIACDQGDLDWANLFITQCSPYLKKQQIEDTVKLANSIVLFKKKQYDEVLKELGNVDFIDLEHAIRSKSLVIRCMYELKCDSPQFDSYYHAFEIFLYRKKKKRPEAVNSLLNFIRLLKLIYEGNTPRATLVEKINATSSLYYRDWLLEKAAGNTSQYAAQRRKRL